MANIIPRITGLLKSLVRRQVLFNAIKNISWLSLDNFVSVAVSAIVGIAVARAIGVEAMGIWSFVIAIYSVGLVVAGLGMDQVVIVDLTNPDIDHRSLLATTLTLRLCTSLLAGLVLFGATFLSHPDNPYQTPLLWLMSATLLIMSFDVWGNWFRSRLMFKFVVIPNVIANLIGGIVKAVLVIHYHSLMALGYLSLIQAIVTESLLLYFIWRYGIWPRFRDIKPALFKSLLIASLPLMLSSIAVFIFTRGSIFFLDAYRTKTEVGLYSAATRISEILYFFPTVLVTVLAPTMYARWREDRALFERNFRTVLNSVTLLLYLVALAVMLASHAIITLLFGTAFAPASIVLTMHVWTLVAVAQGTMTSIWLMAEKHSGLLMLRTVAGGAANILLNFSLIPHYGIVGAAISALISMFIAGVLIHAAFGPEFRQMLKWQIRSLLLLDVLPSIRVLLRS